MRRARAHIFGAAVGAKQRGSSAIRLHPAPSLFSLFAPAKISFTKSQNAPARLILLIRQQKNSKRLKAKRILPAHQAQSLPILPGAIPPAPPHIIRPTPGATPLAPYTIRPRRAQSALTPRRLSQTPGLYPPFAVFCAAESDHSKRPIPNKIFVEIKPKGVLMGDYFLIVAAGVSRRERL